MAILGVIMAAVAVIFVTALKNYRTESEKTVLQRNINFALDNITRDAKEATAIPESHDTFTTSENTLVLALPAENVSDNFVYSGNTLVKDYIIYYLDGNNLKRKVYANAAGTRTSEEKTVLKNVTSLSFTYLPDIATKSGVKTAMTTSVDVGKGITLSEERSTNLRNFNE